MHTYSLTYIQACIRNGRVYIYIYTHICISIHIKLRERERETKQRGRQTGIESNHVLSSHEFRFELEVWESGSCPYCSKQHPKP